VWLTHSLGKNGGGINPRFFFLIYIYIYIKEIIKIIKKKW